VLHFIFEMFVCQICELNEGRVYLGPSLVNQGGIFGGIDRDTNNIFSISFYTYGGR
jgi:hypothetical protein